MDLAEALARGSVQIDEVVSRLVARYAVLDMTVEDPPMEQVIAHIYQSAGSDEG